MDYLKESITIFLANWGELTGTQGALALVFLFAIFLVFYKASKGFGSQQDD